MNEPDSKPSLEAMGHMARYERLCHAMQSGVKFEQEEAPEQAESLKHLRTGINNALVINGVIVELLIKKGLVTEVEYAKALADGMEREVDRYEKILTERFGKPVKLY